MTVIKVAAGLGYTRKQLAVYQCVAATGRDSARVYEILAELYVLGLDSLPVGGL